MLGFQHRVAGFGGQNNDLMCGNMGLTMISGGMTSNRSIVNTQVDAITIYHLQRHRPNNDGAAWTRNLKPGAGLHSADGDRWDRSIPMPFKPIYNGLAPGVPM